MKLLLLSEACAMVRITPGGYDKLKEKPFPAFKQHEKGWRYVLKSDVEAYLEECLIKARSLRKEPDNPKIKQRLEEVWAKHLRLFGGNLPKERRGTP